METGWERLAQLGSGDVPSGSGGSDYGRFSGRTASGEVGLTIAPNKRLISVVVKTLLCSFNDPSSTDMWLNHSLYYPKLKGVYQTT